MCKEKSRVLKMNPQKKVDILKLLLKLIFNYLAFLALFFVFGLVMEQDIRIFTLAFVFLLLQKGIIKIINDVKSILVRKENPYKIGREVR